MRVAALICSRRSRRTILLWFWAALALGATGSGTVTLEAFVRARLPDVPRNGPTRIYARPLVLYRGATVDRSRITSHLRRLGYRRATSYDVGIGEYRLGSWTWVIGRRAFRHADRVDPGGVTEVAVTYRGRITSVRGADGRLVDAVALEPELIRSIGGPGRDDRIPVRLADIPRHLIDAVLTIEDQRFFDHHGLDGRRVAGAMLANVRAGRITQGASTLTQQLVKNLFLSARRSPIRKLREMAMALVLELRYHKTHILEVYLNEVYLGQRGALAIRGVGRAAQFYFGKDVSQLELHEAALFAGIIRGPSLYAPFRHPEAARARRDLVLRLMRERDVISEDAYRSARSAPLGLRQDTPAPRSGRYFADYVEQQLRARYGSEVLRGGFAVITTLDMRLQHAAEDAVREGLARLERAYPRLTAGQGRLQAALVALDHRTGEILAMVGGRDYGATQFNRAVMARRQPGSAFKPIVALSALSWTSRERNWREPAFTLASVLDDEPLSVETPGGPWQPKNYDRRFRGPVTLREALERSLNVPFARLGMDVGPERIVATARALGISTPLTPVLSIALGSNEVTPLDMTRAYGVFAAGGYRADLQFALGVLEPSGNVLPQFAAGGQQVYDPAEVYLVTSALVGAVERGTGQALRRLGYWGPVAAKSGTTNNYRDAWFIGYTPSLTVGVWVGFDDGRSIGLPGSRAALPIFGRFLVDAQGRYGTGAFEMPFGLETVEVERRTGLRAGRGCRGEREVFLRGTAPTASCSPYWASRRRYGGRRINDRSFPSIGQRRRVSRRGG